LTSLQNPKFSIAQTLIYQIQPLIRVSRFEQRIGWEFVSVEYKATVEKAFSF